jgi:sugar lactone lactonase YvrE
MGRRVGFGNYQYEHVENWPKVEIQGAAADVTVDAQGRVYVGVRNDQPDGSLGTSKGGTGHVVVLDRDGNEIGNWGNFASAPHGLWVNQEGEIFFADTGFHTITKHAPTGEVLLTLGTKGQPGAPGAPFNRPTHAVQAPNGDIFVSDGYGQNRIHRFSAKGEHILSFGSGRLVFGEPNPGLPSTGQGEFNVPHDVVVDGDSRVIVSDRENNRIQVFTTDGEFVTMWTPVNHPNKIQFDADGLLHIIGGSGAEVRKPDGTVVGNWGSDWGDGPGQFIRGPHGCWLDTDGTMYTADAGFRNRLQKFVRV